MKLYTKTGDDGTTQLMGGMRVLKNNLRVTAYGEVDELNAAIGVVISGCDDDELVTTLRRIQADLFMLGAKLATPRDKSDEPRIDESHVHRLEQWIDAATDETPSLRNFILPGGTSTAAALHLARTINRRAERVVVDLGEREPVDRCLIVYLNRLSDLLFVLARRANHRAGVPDIVWTAQHGASE